MKLEKILDIMYAELVNTPYISAFRSIAFSIADIQKGSLLYLANDYSKADIKGAVERGVYGIVVDKKPSQAILNIDNEIAWIYLDNMLQGIKRLLRFLLLESNITLVYCTRIEIHMIKTLKLDIQIAQSIGSMAQVAFSLHTKTDNKIPNIIATSMENIGIDDILNIKSLQYKRLEHMSNTTNHTSNISCNIFSYSLFETRLIYDSSLYHISIPFIFMPCIESVLNMCRSLDNMLDTSYLTYINLRDIKVRFIELDSLTLVNKTLLFVPNKTLLNDLVLLDSDFSDIADSRLKLFMQHIESTPNALLAYLGIYASHLKIIICDKEGDTRESRLMYYKDVSELHEILQNNSFNLAVILDTSKEMYKTYAMDFIQPDSHIQQSLF